MATEYEPVKAYVDEMNIGNGDKIEYPNDKELSLLVLQISEPTIANKGEEGPLIPTSNSICFPFNHQQLQQAQQRLVSLDIFRGLTIVVKSQNNST
ncbi:hypothetical protein CRYUN_Cryun24cG0076600 [Craigia yunnanensis]